MQAIVAGTGHGNRSKHIRKHVKEGLLVDLVREPGNPVDPNAILVIAVVRSLFGKKRVDFGYLKKGLAARLAPKLDAGEEHVAKVDSFWLPDDPDKWPRVTLTIEKRRDPVSDRESGQ